MWGGGSKRREREVRMMVVFVLAFSGPIENSSGKVTSEYFLTAIGKPFFSPALLYTRAYEKTFE